MAMVRAGQSRHRQARRRRLLYGMAVMALSLSNRTERRHWVRPWLLRRPDLGAYNTLVTELAEEDESSFLGFIRLSPGLYSMLLERVTPHIEKEITNCRSPIPAGLRLAITLRFLATGETYRSLSYLFRVSHNSICGIIPETCRAIYEVLKDEYFKCPSTPEEWRMVAEEYWTRWNFPNCLGSLDGKHVMIQKPACSGLRYFNYKHHFSIILMALADANYKFLFVDIGAQGRLSDGGVFSETMLREALDGNTIGLPGPMPFPGVPDSEAMPFCIVADDAFPLKHYLQKPYPSRNLSKEQRIYNYRLSRARRCVENAFGILTNRFRVFLRPVAITPDRVDAVVMASCALHNMLRAEAPASYAGCADVEDCGSHSVTEGCWRLTGSFPPARQSGCRSATAGCKEPRDSFCHYFNSADGALPWQDDMIPSSSGTTDRIVDTS